MGIDHIRPNTKLLILKGLFLVIFFIMGLLLSCWNLKQMQRTIDQHFTKIRTTIINQNDIYHAEEAFLVIASPELMKSPTSPKNSPKIL